MNTDQSITPKIDVQGFETIIKTHFPNLWRPTVISLSCAATLLLKDNSNPVGVIFMGSPSSGKTTVLDFFRGLSDIVYHTDHFTAKAFVTHSANVKEDELSKIDLLPRIRHKLVVVPELSPLFGKRKDDLLETIAILTRLFDGQGLTTDSGTRGQRGYTGDYLFSFLGATTPIDNHVWNVLGKLGARWLFYSMPNEVISPDDLVHMMQESVSYGERVVVCRETVHVFLSTLFESTGGVRGIQWNRAQDDGALLGVIAKVAQLVAKLRGTVSIWEKKSSGYNQDDYNYTIPIIELPLRLTQILYNLARGRAIIWGRKQINKGDVKMVVQVALCSMPDDRRKVFRGLLHNQGTLVSSQVEEILRCSRPTAYKAMETLSALGIVDLQDDQKGKSIVLRGDFQWFLSDEFQSHIKA